MRHAGLRQDDGKGIDQEFPGSVLKYSE